MFVANRLGLPKERLGLAGCGLSLVRLVDADEGWSPDARRGEEVGRRTVHAEWGLLVPDSRDWPNFYYSNPACV